MFDSVAKELDPNFEVRKDRIISECRAQLSKAIDPEDYASVLQEGAENAINFGNQAVNSPITPRILVWDLITIAYSDGVLDKKENQLLKYVVRKLNIENEVFMEMKSSYLALMDLENESTWIKTTNRPYMTIEAIVNELADRKAVILDSIKELIAN